MKLFQIVNLFLKKKRNAVLFSCRIQAQNMARGPARWGINTSVIVFVKAFWWICFDIIAANIAAFYDLWCMKKTYISEYLIILKCLWKVKICSIFQVPSMFRDANAFSCIYAYKSKSLWMNVFACTYAYKWKN